MKDGKHVVLCVDDDLDIREQMEVILAANGYECVTAASAREGVIAYREHSPDLVIVDLMMEEPDAGLGLVGTLTDLGSQAPIFMLSSAGDELHGQIDTSNLGIRGVLQKPVDPGTLLMIVSRSLGG